jgi:tetratricopeptide (TPR) repeat protein
MQFDEELIREIEIEFSTNCLKCSVNPSLERGYCTSCLEDFISKSLASQIIECTVPKLEKVIVYYKELLPQYSFGNQVRLSRNDVMAFAASHPDINTVKYKWSNHALKCRLCKTTEKPHYGGGYCADCYKNSKEFTAMNGYLNGENLSELGDAMGITRERARQLFEKAIKIETERVDPDRPQLSAYELKEQLKNTNRRNRAKRDYKELIENNYDDILKKISGTNIISEKSLLKVLDMPESVLTFIKLKYPEFIEIVNTNSRRWSWKYDQCRMCGTTEIKHKRWGYCQNCYTKSDEWRETQSQYRQNHIEEVRERARVYGAAYSKRPEVKEKLRQRTHEKNFDGNRELAFQIHGACCNDCGITRDDFKEMNSKDLAVYHTDGNPYNNDTSNLRPLCFSCLAKQTKV